MDSKSGRISDAPGVPWAERGAGSGRRRWRWRLTVWGAPAVVVVSSGCAAVSPERRAGILEEAEPAAWTSSAARVGGVDQNWIASFQDRTLERLVAEAEEQNHDLKVAAARLSKAQASAQIAGADLYPSIAGRLSGSRRQQAFIGFPFGGATGESPAAAGDGGMEPAAMAAAPDPATDGVLKSLTNTFGVSLDVDWELDVWGRIRAGQSAAIAEAEGAAAELQSVRASIAAQTAKAWFALQEAELQLRLANDSLQSYADSEDIIRARYEVADQPASQLRLAKSAVAGAKAAVEERKNLKQLTMRQLEVLLGRYPSAELAVDGALPPPPRPTPAGLPSGLLQRRPDLQAAERRVAAAERRILEAKLAVLPQFSLTGSGGTTTQKLRDVLDTDFSVWSLAGDALQPLLAGGRIKGNYRLRSAESEEAMANYHRAALEAFREVESALTAELLLARREAALTESRELLVESYEETRQEYREGLSDVITLLTTQRQMLEVKGQVLGIRRLRLDNRVDLHLALGGDFRLRTPPATKTKITP